MSKTISTQQLARTENLTARSETPGSARRYSVFVDSHIQDLPDNFSCEGNSALVYSGDRDLAIPALEQEQDGGVICEIKPSGEDDTISVIVTQGGRRIELCVHGLLAAAFHWMNTNSLSSLGIDHPIGHLTCQAVEEPLMIHAAGPIEARDLSRENLSETQRSKIKPALPKSVSITIPALDLQTFPIPDWLPIDAHPKKITASAASIEPKGYLILEYASGTDLNALASYRADWNPENQRAVIYTCVEAQEIIRSEAIDHASAMPTSDNHGHREQSIGAVNARYFAPQYGNPEDAATGSAARALASYYASQHPMLVIRQRSDQGGIMHSTLSKDKTQVTIGGYVHAR